MITRASVTNRDNAKNLEPATIADCGLEDFVAVLVLSPPFIYAVQSMNSRALARLAPMPAPRFGDPDVAGLPFYLPGQSPRSRAAALRVISEVPPVKVASRATTPRSSDVSYLADHASHHPSGGPVPLPPPRPWEGQPVEYARFKRSIAVRRNILPAPPARPPTWPPTSRPSTRATAGTSTVDPTISCQRRVDAISDVSEPRVDTMWLERGYASNEVARLLFPGSSRDRPPLSPRAPCAPPARTCSTYGRPSCLQRSKRLLPTYNHPFPGLGLKKILKKIVSSFTARRSGGSAAAHSAQARGAAAPGAAAEPVSPAAPRPAGRASHCASQRAASRTPGAAAPPPPVSGAAASVQLRLGDADLPAPPQRRHCSSCSSSKHCRGSTGAAAQLLLLCSCWSLNVPRCVLLGILLSAAVCCCAVAAAATAAAAAAACAAAAAAAIVTAAASRGGWGSSEPAGKAAPAPCSKVLLLGRCACSCCCSAGGANPAAAAARRLWRCSTASSS
jgi:hypothetical protein